ncbi:MAG: nucleoside hydrolase [Tissierellia bacterium]|nr:nucleoside hydrolase [Tissierellia bacterium]
MRKNIIIDVDTGIDDATALMLALSSPELNILGITTVAGNVEVERASLNTLKVLEIMEKNVPVYEGANKPLVREHIAAYETHGKDGLGDVLDDSQITREIEKMSAKDFILKSLKEYEDVIIVAVGPMTNIALALKEDPNAFKNLDRIISMGGAYKAHGNCSPVAEYNYWVDPDAADYVFKNSPKKLEMVGLDVTRKIVLTPDMVKYARNFPSLKQEFLESITKFYMDFHKSQEGTIGCVINDPLAVMAAIFEDILKGFEAYTEVVHDGVAMGQAIVDDHDFWKREKNSIIYTEVDHDKFFLEFFDRVLNIDISKLLGKADE